MSGVLYINHPENEPITERPDRFNEIKRHRVAAGIIRMQDSQLRGKPQLMAGR
jgi:hypothetical protein